MASSKQIRNSHAKQYIQEVFQASLVANGFFCPDDKLLCWYRLKNQDIYNSIIFFSRWPNLPLMMEIGYGICPLFVKPIYTRGVHFSKRPVEDERFIEQAIVESGPIDAVGYCRYSDHVLVDAPSHSGKGIYTLNNVLLPKMDSVSSIEDAYVYHKERRANYQLKNNLYPLGTMSQTFIEMALSVDDKEIYPYCKSAIVERIALLQRLSVKAKNGELYQKELQQWEPLHHVFVSGDRGAYLELLSRRAKENYRYLTDKLKIIP